MNYKHIIYAFLISLLVPVAVKAAGPVTVKASLDSAYLLMGKQTLLKVNVVQDAGSVGHFITNNGDTLTSEVEVIKQLSTDTTDLGSNRQEIERQLIIQSFDSGLYTIPPFVYVNGNETIASNQLVLKVIPVPVDTLTTIHDYAGVANPNTKIWDYLPDFVVNYWWIIVIIVVLAAAGFVWYKYFRGKKKISIMPKKKEIPPYELAMQELNKLKGEKLCENGQEKIYYTRLTEILRTYLEKRFGINAMEMTSTQILAHIRDNETTRPAAPVMRQILEMADFVKFAKVRPLPDDNLKSFNSAVKFIEDTKPVEVAPEADDKNSSTDKTDSK